MCRSGSRRRNGCILCSLILRLANSRPIPRGCLAGQARALPPARASYLSPDGSIPILQRLWQPTDPLQYTAKRFLAICSELGINVDLIDDRMRLDEHSEF